MIAKNFIQFPDALLAQRELELVLAAGRELTKEACKLINKSIRACIAWACEFVTSNEKDELPGWFKGTKARERKLARACRRACLELF